MIVGDVMDEVGTALDAISGLRVYDFPSDHITPPAAVVAYPDQVIFDETYGRGMDRITVPVLVMVGKASDRASRDNLSGYVDGSGSSSVKAAVDGGTYTACDTVRVVSATFDVVIIAGVSYAAALFELDITGSGT